MPDPVFFLSRFRVKQGHLPALLELTTETGARLEEGKPRTLLFLVYVDAGGGAITFLHAFADAESMDVHILGADERSRAALEHIEPLGWEVYGQPSSAALEVLRHAAEAGGVSLAVHPEYVSGFLRLGPSGRSS